MLTERQKRILWVIVDDYIASAEPVGSRTVAKREGMGFSPATVRNEMADLEEMGFLQQPHTSAGRIPSEKGYRFYVDHLLIPKMWQNDEITALHEYFLNRMDQMDQVIKYTSTFLSQLTNYMTMIVSPKIDENLLKHIQLIPLTDRMAVSILVTNKGHVKQRRIQLPEGVLPSKIEKLMNLLNGHLIGSPISNLKKIVQYQLQEEISNHIGHFDKMMLIIDQMLQVHHHGEQVFMSGTTRMLEQPEFQDIRKMKSLLDLIEKNETIIQLLEPIMDGVQVRIGKEISIEGVTHCSIITASYVFNNEPVGTIGVLGPTRMDYEKVIRLIELLAKVFSDHLRALYEGD